MNPTEFGDNEPTVEADARWMGDALQLAASAASDGDVPVGAVVVIGGCIAGRGRNRRVAEGRPLAHAEMEALEDAARTVGHWRLDDATVYVTLEPCAMCAGALVQTRVRRLVYGATDAKAGAVRSLWRLADDPRATHRIQVRSDVRAEESARLLRSFFEDLRARKTRSRGP